MKNDLSLLKHSLMIDNALKLKSVVEILMEEFHNSKRKTSLKLGIAKAISDCMKTQMKLFEDIPPSSAADIYLKVLCSPDGRIDRQSLLDQADDYKSAWDGLQTLEQAELIKISSKGDVTTQPTI